MLLDAGFPRANMNSLVYRAIKNNEVILTVASYSFPNACMCSLHLCPVVSKACAPILVSLINLNLFAQSCVLSISSLYTLYMHLLYVGINPTLFSGSSSQPSL